MTSKKRSMPSPSASPWTQPNTTSLFHTELELARENLDFPGFRPMQIFSWIQDNHATDLLFRGLAKLAPMFAVPAYRGETALWISPPPSGSGNTIYIVMGIDKNNALRLVGGNYFNQPVVEPQATINPGSFFSNFDDSTGWDRYRLIANAVKKSIASVEKEDLHFCELECAHFHTMLVSVGPAVIEGNRPANFSFEYVGEIK
jgi:hypothetical protein